MIVIVGFMVAMMTVIIFFNIFYANNQSMNEEINQRKEEDFKKNFSDVGVKRFIILIMLIQKKQQHILHKL